MFASPYIYNLEVIKLLIKAGADVNAKDKKGWTPLLGALKASTLNPKDDHRNIRALILAGAKISEGTYPTVPFPLLEKFWDIEKQVKEENQKEQ